MARTTKTKTTATKPQPEAEHDPSSGTDSLSAALGTAAPVDGAGPAMTPGDIAPAPAPSGRSSKLNMIRARLAAPEGASLAALCAATGWQSHSVRAALTGLRKGGETVEKGKAADGTTVYRIAAAAESSK